MTLAYLMNSYPMTSTTFIRREIAAHEAAGVPVSLFSIRPWSEELVEPADIVDQARTTYILGQPRHRLLTGVLREIVTRPLAFLLGLRASILLARLPGGAGLRNFAYLVEAVVFRQAAATIGISHVHAHFSTNSAAVALLAHRMGGPNYSFTAHGPDEFDDTVGNGLAIKVRHAAFVAAITDYARGVIVAAADAADAAKVHVVRCGIDLEEFTPTAPPPNKRIVCVGRLCSAKAQGLLLEAIAPLIAEHPTLELILIGDGEDRPALEAQIAALGLGSHVTLTGWGTGQEVRDAIRGARVFALPSFAEGLPIVLMESLAMGRAVVTTQITGIPELVDGECGWIVPPGDVAALRESIAEALSADTATLARLGATGRKRVMQSHDQTKNAGALRDLFALG